MKTAIQAAKITLMLAGACALVEWFLALPAWRGVSTFALFCAWCLIFKLCEFLGANHWGSNEQRMGNLRRARDARKRLADGVDRERAESSGCARRGGNSGTADSPRRSSLIWMLLDGDREVGQETNKRAVENWLSLSPDHDVRVYNRAGEQVA